MNGGGTGLQGEDKVYLRNCWVKGPVTLPQVGGLLRSRSAKNVKDIDKNY